MEHAADVSFGNTLLPQFLPKEILSKSKHGFGLPFGHWLKTDRQLQDLVYGTLDSLSNRNILSKTFIHRIARDHRDGHAAYYGYAIWDLLILGQWLDRHS